MSRNNKIHFLYNPSEFSDNEIMSNFVIRIKEFEILFENIKTDKMLIPPQHFLIIGQRGFGKTTLLLRLRLEIKNNNRLKNIFIPVLFEEEQYNISSLADFWENTLKKLAAEDKSFNESLGKIDELFEEDFPEEALYNLLNSELKKNNKKVILFVDNFDDIIKKFEIKERQRLREVLITSSEIKFIAASSLLLESFYEYSEPFFEFFRSINLKELSKNETIAFLRNLGEKTNPEKINKIINDQPERIETLRRLTGGVPRTIALLFDVFLDDIAGNSFNDLVMLLDRVTPLYKHRMDNFSPAQQLIVNAVALNWDAMSTNEISKITRLPSKTVSSQLNQLVKNRIIEKIVTSKKNHLYIIKERFFNIFYLMRYGNKKDKKNILWLTKFLEIWLNRDELEERAVKHLQKMQGQDIDDGYAFYVSNALLENDIPEKIKEELIVKTCEYLKNRKSNYQDDFSKSRVSTVKVMGVNNNGNLGRNIFFNLKTNTVTKTLLDYNIEKKDTGNSITNNAIIPIFDAEIQSYIKDNQTDKAFEIILNAGYKDDDADLIIGTILHLELNRISESISFYNRSALSGNTKAMINLGFIFMNEYKDFRKAEEYYLKAVEKNDEDAMNNLAFLYETKIGNYNKAKEYYHKSVNSGRNYAMYNLGHLYLDNFKDIENSIKYFSMAAEKGIKEAFFDLALVYHDIKNDLNKAEEYYIIAAENGDTRAMFNLALLYQIEYKDYKKTEDYYKKAIEGNHVGAMFNLAKLYEEIFKDFKKSEEYYLMASDKNHSSASYNLALLYEIEFKDYIKAIEFYLKADEQDHPEALNGLAILYQNELNDSESAEEYYKKAIIKNNINAKNNLALLNFYFKKDKESSLNLYNDVYLIKMDNIRKLWYIIMLAWNNQIENSMTLIDEVINSPEKYSETDDSNLILAIKMLLAKKQYYYTYNLFNKNNLNLKDKFKPLYYAVLSLLGNEYSDELKRMGSELMETVEEILEDIKKIAIDYA